MVGAVVECSTAALRVAGSIPARNKYLYDVHVVIPSLARYVSFFFKCSHDRVIDPTVCKV